MRISKQAVCDFWNRACACRERGAVGGPLWMQHLVAATFGAQDPQRLLVGGANRIAVEDLLHPGSYRPRERVNRNGRRTVRRGSGAGRARLFTPGRKWNEVLVVPFLSRPGQIVGMAFADANEARPCDFQHRSFVPSAGGWQEAGFGMLNAVPSQSTRFGSSLFVFLDLLPALRLQFKSLTSSSTPLPVVVARDEGRQRTVGSWRQFASRKPILVADRIDARLFRQASLGAARIVVDPDLPTMLCPPPQTWPFEEGFFDPLEAERILRWSYRPISWLLAREKIARPWMDVLVEHLKALSPQQAESLLNEIGLPLLERFQVLKHLRRACVGASRWKGSALAAPRIRLGDKVIVEREDGWFDESIRRRICDVVRVDRILEGSSSTKLQGRVLGKGGETDFAVDFKAVQRCGLLSATKKAMSSAGVSWSFKFGWSKRGMEIATAFQELDNLAEAEVHSEVDIVGSTVASFRFPNLQITAGGFQTEVHPPFLATQLPAANLRAPGELKLRKCRPIAFDLPAVRTFWAVVRLFIAMVMAPTLRIDSPGVVLVGTKSNLIVDTLQQVFGCQNVKVSGRGNRTRQRERLQRQICQHRWPSMIQTAAGRISSARLVKLVVPRNCFAAIERADHEQFRAAGWWTVDVADAAQAAQLIDQFGSDVVLNYLHSYIARRFEVNFDAEDMQKSLWEDVSHWFGKFGRGREARASADSLILAPAKWGGESADSFSKIGSL